MITNSLVVSAYQAIEKSLEELGERWTSVCKWVEDQWLRLEDVDIKWRSYHSIAGKFDKWLDEKEVTLGRMMLSDVSDPHILVNQIHKLKVTHPLRSQERVWVEVIVAIRFSKSKEVKVIVFC